MARGGVHTEVMADDIATTWTNALTEEQIKQLEWLRAAKCTVEASYIPPDPLHDQPEGVLLEILVDKHAVVKYRGTPGEIPRMFNQALNAARALFTYVNEAEQRYRSAE